jgi:hypothetical protein
MWICKICEESIKEDFDFCWKCGWTKEGNPPYNPQSFQYEEDMYYYQNNCRALYDRKKAMHFNPQDELVSPVFITNDSIQEAKFSMFGESCPNCGGYKLKRIGNALDKKNSAIGGLFFFALFTYGLTLLLLPFFCLKEPLINLK